MECFDFWISSRYKNVQIHPHSFLLPIFRICCLLRRLPLALLLNFTFCPPSSNYVSIPDVSTSSFTGNGIHSALEPPTSGARILMTSVSLPPVQGVTKLLKTV